MSTIIYPALVSGDETAGYQADFPDLPTCQARGGGLGELMTSARAAVSAELQRLVQDGHTWPRASALGELKAAPGQAVVLVDVQIEDTPVRVNISIGENLLKRLDAAAEARGTTRSGFIATAVRQSLGERIRPLSADFEAAARQIRDELTQFGKKLGEQIGPDSAFSRSVADLDEKVLETVRKAADNVSASIAKRKEEMAARKAAQREAGAGPEATQH